MAIASLILGIISVVLAFIPCLGYISAVTSSIGFALGVAALIIAIVKRLPKGKAITGLILNGVSWIIFLVVSLVFLSSMESSSRSYDSYDYSNYSYQ